MIEVEFNLWSDEHAFTAFCVNCQWWLQRGDKCSQCGKIPSPTQIIFSTKDFDTPWRVSNALTLEVIRHG